MGVDLEKRLEEVAFGMRELYYEEDFELAHIMADKLLIHALKILGESMTGSPQLSLMLIVKLFDKVVNFKVEKDKE